MVETRKGNYFDFMTVRIQGLHNIHSQFCYMLLMLLMVVHNKCDDLISNIGKLRFRELEGLGQVSPTGSVPVYVLILHCTFSLRRSRLPPNDPASNQVFGDNNAYDFLLSIHTYSRVLLLFKIFKKVYHVPISPRGSVIPESYPHWSLNRSSVLVNSGKAYFGRKLISRDVGDRKRPL